MIVVGWGGFGYDFKVVLKGVGKVLTIGGGFHSGEENVFRRRLGFAGGCPLSYSHLHGWRDGGRVRKHTPGLAVVRLGSFPAAGLFPPADPDWRPYILSLFLVH